MRFFTSLLLLTTGLCRSPFLTAQNTPAPSQSSTDQAARQKAMALFVEGKRLEALPLLEPLLQKSPQDPELLVTLAACLVEHAATLTEPDAAAKDRFRARDLVQKGWELGNTSPLAENLRQLLGELPANGSIKFSENPAVERIMEAGEAAFARRDFDEALKNYTQAMELEPKNYSAVLFAANSYDRKNDLPKAAQWYERAIQLDPNVETAYRYYADMLAKQGDMAKARGMLIHAAVAEPYNKIVWREIRAWATINKIPFNVVFAAIPLPRKDDTAVGGGKLPAEIASAWRTYYSVKADWEKGGRFEKQFPQEGEYRHSLLEESDALSATIRVLKRLEEDKKTAALVKADPTASLLLKLNEAGAIDAYVLFSLGDDDIAKDYVPYRAKNRDRLEGYMDRFAMPH